MDTFHPHYKLSSFHFFGLTSGKEKESLSGKELGERDGAQRTMGSAGTSRQRKGGVSAPKTGASIENSVCRKIEGCA